MLQGTDIMDHGIDFHQFISWHLRTELLELGFRRVEDFLEVVSEDDLPSRKDRVLLLAVRSNFVLTWLYRVFYADSYFFCQK